MNATQEARPVFVRAGEGIKASAQQTGGALGL